MLSFASDDLCKVSMFVQLKVSIFIMATSLFMYGSLKLPKYDKGLN